MDLLIIITHVLPLLDLCLIEWARRMWCPCVHDECPRASDTPSPRCRSMAEGHIRSCCAGESSHTTEHVSASQPNDRNSPGETRRRGTNAEAHSSSVLQLFLRKPPNGIVHASYDHKREPCEQKCHQHSNRPAQQEEQAARGWRNELLFQERLGHRRKHRTKREAEHHAPIPHDPHATHLLEHEALLVRAQRSVCLCRTHARPLCSPVRICKGVGCTRLRPSLRRPRHAACACRRPPAGSRETGRNNFRRVQGHGRGEGGRAACVVRSHR